MGKELLHSIDTEEQSISRESRLVALNLYDDEERIEKIASALSLKVRRDIIKLVNNYPNCSINDISWKMNIPISNASFHVKSLVSAGILAYSSNTKKKGNEKRIILGSHFYSLALGKNESHPRGSFEVRNITIPIGSYSKYKVNPPCGIYLGDSVRYAFDTPAVFSVPDRFSAQLIWLNNGYLEYTLPIFDYNYYQSKVEYFDRRSIYSVSFQFEICSEAAGYDQNYKSDVTFSAAGRELFTFTLSGDYGERRGRLNPDTYPNHLTQYGLLKTVDIRFDGTYLDEKRVSDISIEDLELDKNDMLKFRFEVKENAAHVGGFNLFGDKIGDHGGHISVSITYQKKAVEIDI